jgi:hypothetical protein
MADVRTNAAQAGPRAADAVQPEVHALTSWHLTQDENYLRIVESLPNGQPAYRAVTIGSTVLAFKPRRTGSHRGEMMCHLPFKDQDVANARMIAAARDMLAALINLRAYTEAYRDAVAYLPPDKKEKIRLAVVANGGTETASHALIAASAAIAKATRTAGAA